jgi:hypothetical protein
MMNARTEPFRTLGWENLRRALNRFDGSTQQPVRCDLPSLPRHRFGDGTPSKVGGVGFLGTPRPDGTNIEQCSPQAVAQGRPTDQEVRRVWNPKGASWS